METETFAGLLERLKREGRLKNHQSDINAFISEIMRADGIPRQYFSMSLVGTLDRVLRRGFHRDFLKRHLLGRHPDHMRHDLRVILEELGEIDPSKK